MDFRREWLKEKVCHSLGLDGDRYFDEMVAAGEDELDDQLSTFLEDDIKEEESEKKLFYIYRTAYDRLVDKEILVPEVGKLRNKGSFIES